jgi:hypothetical protein
MIATANGADSATRSGSVSDVAKSLTLAHIATAEDVAEVFRSSDPMAAIDEQLARIADAERKLAQEREKWLRVKGAAELVVDVGTAIGQVISKNGVEQRQASGNAARRVPQIRPRRARPRPRRPQLNERQAATLRLMKEEPERTWKLREIVAGLTERQWVENSKWLDNLLAKDLPQLVAGGLLERPMKGAYKLPGNRVPGTQEEGESTLLSGLPAGGRDTS